jgi:hypothetical protein
MCKKLIFLISFVSVIVLVGSASAEAPDANLLAWWPMDEGAGVDVCDMSPQGNSYDGERLGTDPDGGPTWVTETRQGPYALEFHWAPEEPLPFPPSLVHIDHNIPEPNGGPHHAITFTAWGLARSWPHEHRVL